MKLNIMVTYYNEKDLVSFGNFLLSDERKQDKIAARDEMVRQGMNPSPIETFMDEVSHADVENWKFEEGLRKSKNFLKTLGVDMSKVRFSTSPNFFFNNENGQIAHDYDTDFRPISVAYWRNLSTADLKKHCEEKDWAIFYITDNSKLMTNEMGVIPSLRCTFFNRMSSYKDDVLFVNSTDEVIINKERFIVIPRELYDENDGDTLEEINNPVNLNLGQFTQDINDLIDETCEANGWTRADEHFQILMADKGIAPKASFKIQ